MRPDILDGSAAEKSHRAIDLVPEYGDGGARPRFASNRGAVEEGAHDT
jgi:hypothetical protein